MSCIALRHSCCLLASLLLACGGGSATEPASAVGGAGEAESESESESESEAESESESEAEAEAEAETESEAEAEAEAESESESEPVTPDPVRATSAEDLHQALLAATAEVSALHRLIEPGWGLGTYDPADTGVSHQCDTRDIETHPGAAFAVHEGDRFRCDRGLRRCTSSDPAGGGYAFYFRHGEGDTVWLDTIVHHARRVPPRDNAATRAFADAGAGVCAFQEALADQEAEAPVRFSVFVGGHTGLVPETLAEHLCGDEAVAAFEQRLLPAMSGARTMICGRNPSRCTFRRSDEQVTIYGTADGPSAIAVTRPGMFQNLARAQEREVQAFLRGLGSHTCAE